MSRPARPLALITGASRGIGLCTARALAPHHDLVLTGRSIEILDWAAENVRGYGAERVTTIAGDLGDARDREDLLDHLLDLDPPVQVLVNNAGVAGSAPLADTDDERWRATMELNLEAPFSLIRDLVPPMLERGWGRVINVASTAALKGYRYTAAYSASKGGLLALTRAVAAELAGKGVTANAICPGFTDTDIVADAVRTIASKTGRSKEQARGSLERFSPLGRLVKPTEVAQMIAYLVSEAGAAITGQALVIDGGETTL